MPKLIDPGETLNCPALVPVPDSDTLRLGSEASDMTLSDPLAVPLSVGEKATENVTLCPGDSVSGATNPLKLNPVPLADICEIVTLEPPELVNDSYCVWLLPT